MIRNLLSLFLVILLFFPCKGQNGAENLSISISDIVKEACSQGNNLSFLGENTLYPSQKDSVNILLTFEKPKQLINADKLYLLKNLNTNTYSNGKIGKEGFVISIKDPFKGANQSYFQLISSDKKTCYNTKLKLEYRPDEEPPVQLPPLTLRHYSINVDPCSSCNADGNKIIYDFCENALKNLKSKSSSERTFNADYLRKRIFNLPRVGEEMVFEIQNVNPLKYDISLSDEPTLLNTEAPNFLTEVFTPNLSNMGQAKALTTDALTNPNENKEIIKAALKNLDEALNIKLNELRNAGDCFNPCDYIKLTVQDIHTYFSGIPQLHYDNATSLENFLTYAIKENFNAPGDTATIKELGAIVNKFSVFRNSAAGTFSYRIPQIKNVDQYIFKLSITPKTNILTGAKVLNQEIAVDILHGFKIDVSSGLFFSKLLDEAYSFRPDSTVIKTKTGFNDSIVYNRRNIIIQEKGNKQALGVSSLFHFYPKITPNLNLSFSLGAGVTFNQKPKLQYLSGLSLLFGKTNRLAVTYGLAFGNVDRLSNKYTQRSEGSDNYYTSIKEAEVELKQKFSSNQFISLTYSIPLFKKKEEVKADPASEEKDKDDNKEDKKDDAKKD